MERPIENATHDETGSRPVQQLDAAPVGPDVERVSDDLRVVTREGDLSVIRDLQPEPGDADVVLRESEGAMPSHAPDGATQSRYRMLVAGHIASDIFCLN